MSKMREAMQSQPDELARLLADTAPAETAADRLAGRGVRLNEEDPRREAAFEALGF